MCAIHGFFKQDNNLIQQMIKLAHHRGPDGNGAWSDSNITLGHNLLSIVDDAEASATASATSAAQSSASEIAGAIKEKPTFECDENFANDSSIPTTVPNKPIYGADDPTVANSER